MIMLIQDLELLDRVPLLSALTDGQKAQVARLMVKRRFERGETLVKQDMKFNALFVLLTGQVRVVRTNEQGREVILATLQRGDYIGEMSLIDHQPHSATVKADQQTEVLMLGRTAFESCLPEPGSLAHALLHGLVQRLRQADQTIECLALSDVQGRVKRALLEMAVRDAQGELRIRDKVSRQDIAKRVGASREMVSRVLGSLQAQQLIELLPNGGLVVKRALELA
ncbi:hypothetical protein CCO03_01415 [Comamonas serinivorans]|uniref:Crp/Fnr family transcriptional regulator n=1 Tax=Comamonas serinivorans TaxID=1082851 RepID=A0A1Y0EJ76_9BURK|nr:Crp/Fnr family transcriptional regulator [Comamonas serinivorans]ARU03520.1 hypothetical protein CCO03_01415 [Comamonas serinivorans]